MLEAPVIIAGAGPGGLTAAVALARGGLPVLLLERAPEVRAAGAGLTLQINAMRMLDALDLVAPIVAAGETLQQMRVETSDGGVLSDASISVAAERFGAPGVAIHRGELTRVLVDQLDSSLIRCGAEVVDFEDDGSGVRVQLRGGESLQGSALIGADGIHSAVRTRLLGEVSLRYAGYTCWRGIANVPRPLGQGVVAERWGNGKRFGIVPIDAERTYWFATENATADGEDGDDVQAEMRTRFDAFATPVDELLGATPSEAILRNDIIDLPPQRSWTRGRVALMGDAAHAMTPNMGQGACQAIEDAVVLAHALRTEATVPEALASYESSRVNRALTFVERSWTIGRVAQWQNVFARGIRNVLTRMTPTAVLDRTLAEAWNVDVPL